MIKEYTENECSIDVSNEGLCCLEEAKQDRWKNYDEKTFREEWFIGGWWWQCFVIVFELCFLILL